MGVPCCWDWMGYPLAGLDGIPPVGTGWGYPHWNWMGYPSSQDWMGIPHQETEQQSKHLLCGRWYFSCVHAGISYHAVFENILPTFVVGTLLSTPIWPRGYPLLGLNGCTPVAGLDRVPPPHWDWMGHPHPHWNWMGVAPCLGLGGAPPPIRR